MTTVRDIMNKLNDIDSVIAEVNRLDGKAAPFQLKEDICDLLIEYANTLQDLPVNKGGVD
jgi:hypothetical protein